MKKIVVPYFDNAEVELDDDDVDLDDPGAAAALAAFLALTKEDRIADTRHVFAYYQDTRQLDEEGYLDEEMEVPGSPAEIWDHVEPGGICLIEPDEDDDNWYVAMEAECDWEVEHGLMLVWRGGKTLCKAGGYDSHRTNADAFADDSLKDVVYKAMDEKFTTYLTR